MNSVMTLLFSFLLLSVASGAPTGILSADDMLNNAQAAQALNAEFQNLTTSDACSSGDTACVSGKLASCVNSTWQTTACPKTLQCFALPSVREADTVNLSCTSQRHAASVIQAAGGTGGIAVANSTSTGSPDDSSNSTTSSTSSSSGDDGGVETVTVTITAASALETVFTSTISPEEASSILFSLTQNAGTTITVSGPLSAVTAASVISSAVSAETTQISTSSAGVDNEAGGVASSISSSIITLSAAPVATATSELAVASTSITSAAGIGY